MDARETIQNLYAEAWQDSRHPYDSDRFLAYLTAPPAAKGGRCSDTFRARRRYVRFMESVQLAFRICFTNQEWERAYTMDDFVRLVEKKARQRNVALRLAEQRVAEARREGLAFPFKVAILSSFLLIGAFSRSSTVLRVLAFSTWSSMVGATVFVTYRGLSYAQKLLRTIQEQPAE